MRAAFVLLAVVAALAPATAAGREAPARPLLLEAVLVRPSKAAPDTLCHLSARLRNAGAAIASSFVFRVDLDGRELGVYRDHLFMDPIAPGETRELPLLSFWTDETGRPLPENGRIVVELTLVRASWMKEEREADGTRVWSDLGAVEGLPQTVSFTIEITRE